MVHLIRSHSLRPAGLVLLCCVLSTFLFFLILWEATNVSPGGCCLLILGRQITCHLSRQQNQVSHVSSPESPCAPSLARSLAGCHIRSVTKKRGTIAIATLSPVRGKTDTATLLLAGRECMHHQSSSGANTNRSSAWMSC